MKKNVLFPFIIILCSCESQNKQVINNSDDFKSKFIGNASDAGYPIAVYQITVDTASYIIVYRGESIAITKK